MIGQRHSAFGLLAISLALGACGGSAGDDGSATTTERSAKIHLSAAQLAAAGIETTAVEWRTPEALIEATAEIEAAANRIARLGSRVVGRVTTLQVVVGDQVVAGDVVAVIDSPELGQAKAEYMASLAAADVARNTVERERLLFQDRITSEMEYQQAEAAAIRAEADREAAENRLHSLGVADNELASLRAERHYSSTIAIRSPLAGVVVARNATLGEVIQPADVLVEVMNLDRVWLLVDVYDTDLRGIRVGQAVSVTTRAYPDDTFEGTVDNIAPILDPVTRSIKVRVVLDNDDLRLKPGMFASVSITTQGDSARALSVPLTALQRSGNEFIVFVAHDDGGFEPRTVRVADPGTPWVAILEGLAEGDKVVSRGAFVLKSEMGKGERGQGH
jgi:cobalt-zinc-cadmium efflux system membrane fusion protein